MKMILLTDRIWLHVSPVYQLKSEILNFNLSKKVFFFFFGFS